MSLCFVFVFSFAVSGCAKLYLKHTPLTPASSTEATVALEVNNARDAEHGANNEMQVGQLRNLYGMPLKLEAKNNLVEAMKALYADALKSAGYQVADSAATKVVVDIAEFFMDGYMGYKVDSAFNVQVVSGGNPTFQTTFSKTKAFAHMSNKDMYAAYDELMNMIAAEAVAIFKSPEFGAAVKGVPAEPAAAEPATPAEPAAAEPAAPAEPAAAEPAAADTPAAEAAPASE
jgi:uncharacterized lipoprotein YajG